MEKRICFDMDGTLNKFYEVENWLDDLIAENTRPYDIAPPTFDAYEMYLTLYYLKELGANLSIVSWTSKSGSPNYNKAVRKSKVEWLKELGIYDLFDEIHIVKYGTPKHTTIKEGKSSILIDDDNTVREKWIRYGGIAVNPVNTTTNENEILDILWSIIKTYEAEEKSSA